MDGSALLADLVPIVTQTVAGFNIRRKVIVQFIGVLSHRGFDGLDKAYEICGKDELLYALRDTGWIK